MKRPSDGRLCSFKVFSCQFLLESLKTIRETSFSQGSSCGLFSDRCSQGWDPTQCSVQVPASQGPSVEGGHGSVCRPSGVCVRIVKCNVPRQLTLTLHQQNISSSPLARNIPLPFSNSQPCFPCWEGCVCSPATVVLSSSGI